MSEFKKLTNSFEQTLKDGNLQNVVIGITESLTDSFLMDGIAKDIPIIGTIISLGKATMSIKDRMFLKKMIHFIEGIKNVDKNKRSEMVAMIDSSKKFRIKVGEKLLYIIDKSEDHIAAEYIAKLFNAFLNNKMTYLEFLRSSAIIQKIFIEDLQWFLSADNSEIEKDRDSEEYFTDFEISFINSGLCATTTDNISVRDQTDWKMGEKYVVDGGRPILYINDIGKKLKEILQSA